jgi:hypothetical protein
VGLLAKHELLASARTVAHVRVVAIGQSAPFDAKQLSSLIHGLAIGSGDDVRPLLLYCIHDQQSLIQPAESSMTICSSAFERSLARTLRT